MKLYTITLITETQYGHKTEILDINGKNVFSAADTLDIAINTLDDEVYKMAQSVGVSRDEALDLDFISVENDFEAEGRGSVELEGDYGTWKVTVIINELQFHYNGEITEIKGAAK